MNCSCATSRDALEGGSAQAIENHNGGNIATTATGMRTRRRRTPARGSVWLFSAVSMVSFGPSSIASGGKNLQHFANGRNFDELPGSRH